MRDVAEFNAEVLGRILNASHALQPEPPEDGFEGLARSIEMLASYIPTGPGPVGNTIDLLVQGGASTLTDLVRDYEPTGAPPAKEWRSTPSSTV